MSKTSTDDSRSYRIQIAGTPDGGDRVPDLSPREASERWLNKLRVSKAESTVSSYHYRLQHFVRFCESEGVVTIDELTGWDIESYETHRREQGLSPLSLNKELGTLKNFLEYCARVELCDESLPEKVDPPDVPRDDHVDETRLHDDDAKALLQYYRNNTDDRVRYSRDHALLALAWYTGARLGGLRSLDVDDYNADEEYVQFTHNPDQETPLKNGRDGERIVGLPGHVCEILDGYIATERHEVFDDYGREPLLASQLGRVSKNGLRAWMYLATVPCLHGDCPHGNERPTCDFVDYSQASKCPSSRSPHQVRTGSITWQLNRGVPPQVVADRVNTSVRVIKRHYDQPTKLEEMRERRQDHLDSLDFDGEGGDGE